LWRHEIRASHKSLPVRVPEPSRSSRKHVYVGVDMIDLGGKTVGTDHDDTATVWPQAGNDA
jgi:hypothetical protein